MNAECNKRISHVNSEFHESDKKSNLKTESSKLQCYKVYEFIGIDWKCFSFGTFNIDADSVCELSISKVRGPVFVRLQLLTYSLRRLFNEFCTNSWTKLCF